MIDATTMNYLKKLPGGEWGSEENKNKLYSLVLQCATEFPNTTLLSVDAGVFGGGSLFPMAMAHKELKNGFAIGVDSWSNKDCVEGIMSEVDREWWGKVDLKNIYATFRLATLYSAWSGYAEHLIGRTDEFLDRFQDDSITLFHQDSSHTVETITKELELWTPKLKIGAYLVVDDTNWESSKAGYAKLPSFGYALVEKFDSWEIWKKINIYDGSKTKFYEMDEVVIVNNGAPFTSVSSTKPPKFVSSNDTSTTSE